MSKYGYIGGSLGMLAGFGFAYKKGSGVLGWFGYGLLGSFIGGTIGSVIATAVGEKMTDAVKGATPAKADPRQASMDASRTSKINEIVAASKKMGASDSDIAFIRESAQKMSNSEFAEKYRNFKAATAGGLPTDKTVNASGNDNWGA